jgi:hypothetical protein
VEGRQKRGAGDTRIVALNDKTSRLGVWYGRDRDATMGAFHWRSWGVLPVYHPPEGTIAERE